MFKKIQVILYIVLISVSSFAKNTLQNDFDAVNSVSKGAFGLNYLQGTKGRASIQGGGSPSGTFLFQVAYRNDAARVLEKNHQFYVGNLFASNYYELMGEYVFGDAQSNHPLDHETLFKNSKNAMPKAQLMVKNWVLEKTYINLYPSSRIAKGFARRGVAGSEFEQIYANYFFNFYLSSINDDYQYLPGFLLATNSPIVESKSLAKSRNLISEVYEYFLGIYGSKSDRVKGLWNIRNAIHNQVSEEVIPMINQYLADNPWYEAEGNTYLQKIRSLLTAYYAFNPQSITDLANDVGLSGLAKASQQISDKGVTPDTLLAFSEQVAKVKEDLPTSAIANDKKASVLTVIVKSCDLLNKEINRLPKVDHKNYWIAILNTIYAEGFLITDNKDYFKSEMESGSLEDSKSLMVDVVEIGTDTLIEAFTGTYQQWVSVAPKMDKFIDNTVKASSLNTAAISLTK